MRNKLFRIYWKLEKIIAPKLRYSQYLYEDVLRAHISPGVRWLDIGCGHQILPAWREKAERDLIKCCDVVVGIDYEFLALKRHRSILERTRGDIRELPFKECQFDVVTANMVVEHLSNPIVVFREIQRVLKNNGVFLLHTPNVYGYLTLMGRLVPRSLRNKLIFVLQGRNDSDIFETYHRANTKTRIEDLAVGSGLKVRQLRMIVTSGQFVLVPPIAVIELILLRILMTKGFRRLRTNIICVLEKAEK